MGAMATTGAAVWAGGANSGAGAAQAVSYCRSGECIARLDTTAVALDDRAEFSSFDANGFTINWLARSTAGRVFYVALKGVDVVVGSLLTQTDTSTPIAESGFGFAPAAAFFVSAARAESTADTPSNHDQVSIGAAVSASSRSAIATRDQDAALDMIVSSASEFDAVYANIDASAVTGLMDISSFDADGFTGIMDDADPAQAFVWYVAFGPAAAGGFSPTNFPFPFPKFPDRISQSTDVVSYGG